MPPTRVLPCSSGLAVLGSQVYKELVAESCIPGPRHHSCAFFAVPAAER